MTIKKGTTRTVLIFKNVVIKLPRLMLRDTWYTILRGLIGNIHENSTWKLNSGKYENGKSYLLCPVLWCSFGGFILIMRRTESITSYEWKYCSTREHQKYFKGDDTKDNYGYLNGKLVKIDYADLDHD